MENGWRSSPWETFWRLLPLLDRGVSVGPVNDVAWLYVVAGWQLIYCCLECNIAWLSVLS